MYAIRSYYARVHTWLTLADSAFDDGGVSCELACWLTYTKSPVSANVADTTTYSFVKLLMIPHPFRAANGS